MDAFEKIDCHFYSINGVIKIKWSCLKVEKAMHFKKRTYWLRFNTFFSTDEPPCLTDVRNDIRTVTQRQLTYFSHGRPVEHNSGSKPVNPLPTIGWARTVERWHVARWKALRGWDYRSTKWAKKINSSALRFLLLKFPYNFIFNEYLEFVVLLCIT